MRGLAWSASEPESNLCGAGPTRACLCQDLQAIVDWATPWCWPAIKALPQSRKTYSPAIAGNLTSRCYTSQHIPKFGPLPTQKVLLTKLNPLPATLLLTQSQHCTACMRCTHIAPLQRSISLFLSLSCIYAVAPGHPITASHEASTERNAVAAPSHHDMHAPGQPWQAWSQALASPKSRPDEEASL
eukprot:356917-Chlamydomonas_euryale.AAC.3